MTATRASRPSQKRHDPHSTLADAGTNLLARQEQIELHSVTASEGTTPDDGQRWHETHTSSAAVGRKLPARQEKIDTYSQSARGGFTPDGGQVGPVPHRSLAAVGSDFPTCQTDIEPHVLSADGGTTPDDGQRWHGTHTSSTVVGPNFPARQSSRDHRSWAAGGEQTEDGSAATKRDTDTTSSPLLADPFLALAADVLDDAEKTRIANENRLRQLTRDEEDSDGEERGFGLTLDHPDVARLATLVDALKRIEHDATLNLNRLLRQHPLHPWIKAQKGIGDKQAARLLAVVGDPYWHATENRPRLVSELWSYCGHGDSSRRIRKGMTQADLFACGSPVAKMRVHLIAVACLKAQGHYADVYYARKNATEGREHAVECRRCGPSGKPAQPGSPWSDGHRHADALRITGKAILRDLWLEARRIHEEAAQ